MANQTKRVQWVDIVKYICIMWVMLSHLDSNTELLKTFYSPFFLNGFLFASGYVYYHREGFAQFFVKKVKGLLVPWLFFSIFNILLAQILTFRQHASLLVELKWNFLQIRGYKDGVWFVAALFMAFIPFYFFVSKYEKGEKTKKDKIIFVVVAFVLSFISHLYSKYMNPNLLPWGSSALPWHLEYVFKAMFWMTLGYLFKDEYEKVYDTKVRSLSVLVVLLIYMIIRYVPFTMGYESDSIIYSYISALMGVFILIYASKRIKPNRYLLYIGQNTIICFALHGKTFSIIQAVFKKIAGTLYADILGNVIASSLFAIVFTVILSFILMIPIYIINTWFPFLIGRKYKKNEKQ